MLKKKLDTTIKENETYVLPSPNEEMRSFVNKFKVDMMEHVVSSIKFAIENKLPIVEVFQFKNSPFVVTINENEFEVNLSHIKKYYMDNEMYELCPRITHLCELLKRKSNEKKESSDDRNGPDFSTE
jgi:hypothetical protein